MKKIFYLIFFAILFFSINISVNAASGYCEYSLIKSNTGRPILDYEKDIKIRFNIDTNKKNKVSVEWISDYEVLSNTSDSYMLYDNSYYMLSYNLKFNANDLYSKIINDNEFSCPKIYGQYQASASFNMNLYYNTPAINNDYTLVELNLIDSKQPQNTQQVQLINKCGVGVIGDRYGMPENMMIEFRKYTNRNEVCVIYNKNGEFCQPFIAGNDVTVSAEINALAKQFIFKKDDLKEVFNGITSTTAKCSNFWVDASESSSGTYLITTEEPESGMGSEITTDEYDQAQQNQQFIDGTRFKDLLGQLKAPLSNLYSEALNFQLTIDGNPNATLNGITTSYELCKDNNNDCSENARYLTERGLKNVRGYCNEIYSQYSKYKNDSDMINRMDECNSFDDFYDRLISEGMVEDLADGCGIITTELAEKLNYFLDIIKIAGPLIALGLGTVDFIKVIANGDADKEMKNAFKKFMIRLGAAALLFIIPIIIAFLLDIFMKPNSGYESDNPFCNVIDWDE